MCAFNVDAVDNSKAKDTFPENLIKRTPSSFIHIRFVS